MPPIISLQVNNEQKEHLETKKKLTQKSMSNYIRNLINKDIKNEEIEFNIEEKIEEKLRLILEEMNIDNIASISQKINRTINSDFIEGTINKMFDI